MSYVGFLLARLHPNSIKLYDPDKIEDVNMSGQLYSYKQIEKNKAVALHEIIRDFSNYYSANGIPKLYDESCQAADIMICGFDNMNARKSFFNSWLMYINEIPEDERKHCLFIDGRLAAEEFQVLCIRGDDDYNINRYSKEWLFSSEEAENTICSYKQTSFMATMIGSIIVNLFVNFCANDIEGDEHPLVDREMPFLVSYDAKMMLFNTEY